MKSLNLDKRYAGLGVLLYSLRSARSCGTGEYPDLVLMGDFCRKCGFEILQILPVNDTGGGASPYGAHSAFALHPIYLRLQNLTTDPDDLDRIERFRRGAETEKMPFHEVYQSKINLLRKIYFRLFSGVKDKLPATDWMERNPWVKEYSAYCYLKDLHHGVSWLDWEERYRNPDADLIAELWKEYPLRLYFYTWLQQEAARQLLSAAHNLEEMGVYLKGDIPILMNKDSADVWMNRRYFDLDFSAGAPPDMFSARGQNWGFPVYDRKTLAAEDYSWWVHRLRESSKYYHAIRLDHVIGFMRIWKIPAGDESAASGFYDPAVRISKEEWLEAGFTSDDLYLLSSCVEREENLHSSHIAFEKFMPWLKSSRIPGWHRLHADFRSERALFSPGIPDEIRDVLLTIYHRRALIEVDGACVPSWSYEHSPVFLCLSDQKKEIFRARAKRYFEESEVLWKKEGYAFLKALQSAGKTLLCGEDLGDVPESTPALLEELGICSLKVVRWNRDYKKPGAPFYLQKEYPFLSVVTTSVHDSSTLRGWWEEDAEGAEALLRLIRREKFAKEKGEEGGVPEETPEDMPARGPLSAQTAREMIEWMMGVNSAIAILPVQDFFAAAGEYLAPSHEQERINVPGLVLESNWVYKMEPLLEELLENRSLHRLGKELVKFRPGGKVEL